jgi:hypothetical protein
MQDIINIVIYFLSTLIIAYFGFRNLSLRRKVTDEIAKRLQAEINKNIIVAEYNSLMQDMENQKLTKSDDFIKFLSDSRDWAFTYIEDVQANLSNFDKQMTSFIEWNNTYGSTAGDNVHSEKIKQISLAYEELKSLLPENNQTPNN